MAVRTDRPIITPLSNPTSKALVFPGLGLGVTVAGARRISDGMISAADAEGFAQMELYDPLQQVHDAMWRPVYPPIELEGR
jgi:malate dehydrogenase (oxaloacetate-decarboxylating)